MFVVGLYPMSPSTCDPNAKYLETDQHTHNNRQTKIALTPPDPRRLPVSSAHMKNLLCLSSWIFDLCESRLDIQKYYKKVWQLYIAAFLFPLLCHRKLLLSMSSLTYSFLTYSLIPAQNIISSFQPAPNASA